MTITVNDTYVHRTSPEVLRKIFGYNIKPKSRLSGFYLPGNNDYVIWFPKLSISSKQRPQCDWRNLLNVTGDKLFVEWIGNPSQRNAEEKKASRYTDRLQVVFGARLGYAGYEFLGVFRCKEEADEKGSKTNSKRYYERVATSVDVDIVTSRHKTSVA